MTISLGDKAKDQVTGYEGICIARTEWLNGCVRCTLQSDKLSKEGAPQDGQVFDEPQLVALQRYPRADASFAATVALEGKYEADSLGYLARLESEIVTEICL